MLSLNGKINVVAKEIAFQGYYMAITVMDAHGGDFSICTNFSSQSVECVRTKSLTVSRLENVEVPQRPFSTGQLVNVSMDVNSFSAVNNGCQWFQGLVPIFGSGWAYNSFLPSGEPIVSSLNGASMDTPYNGLYGTSTWSWFDDVDYHSYHTYYQVNDFDLNGTWDLCHTIYQKDCPDEGGLFGVFA